MTKTPLKLLTESDFSDLEIIVEQKNVHEPKIVKIRGPYIVAETKNGNGRIYPADLISESVTKFQKQFIDTSRAVGELNHPQSVEIDYNNACHRILSLTRQDNIWIGESQVLVGTPKGDLLSGLLQNGVKVGISTRGVGNINEKKVVDEYKLITADIVYEPSASLAMMECILESKSYMITEHGDIVEYAFTKMTENLATLPKNTDDRKQKIVATLADFLRSI